MARWAISYGSRVRDFAPVIVENVEIGADSYRVDDTERPRADGLYFGQDFVDPADVRLWVAVRVKPQGSLLEMRASLREVADRFSLLWDAEIVRSTPGSLAELYAGELGVYEGRPRRVEWDWSAYRSGLLRGVATFVRASSLSYLVDASGEAPWHEVSVGLVPAQIGGLVAPLTAPLSTAVSSSRARPFEVGGEAPAWPIITVHGPLQSGGQVELAGQWALHLNRGLAYDEQAVFDTRPGRRAMTLNGRSVNLLSPSGARLSEASFLPGVQEIALRGASVEGTASVSARWRETKAGI